MFNPSKANKDKAEKAGKQKAINDLRTWAMEMVPEDLRDGLIIDVSEVICGDPSCAPVDTVVTLVWEPSGKGLFSIAASPAELTRDDLQEEFPDRETLDAWKVGKRARWPKLPSLRFNVGDRVECRIGPHPVKGWAPGRIIKLYYSESSWPPNMVVPYQIALHDGRLIFAPQDNDQLIRLRPPAAPDAPSSPEYRPDSYMDYEDDEGDYEDEEGDDEHHMDEEDEGDERVTKK
mmetsp:Transcript_16041/g.11571  ORF Transcript_16041/g.11571 Transcript_16041/m.11571 type:complete len:233 (-) Transcript_16041:208-906(-)